MVTWRLSIAQSDAVLHIVRAESPAELVATSTGLSPISSPGRAAVVRSPTHAANRSGIRQVHRGSGPEQGRALEAAVRGRGAPFPHVNIHSEISSSCWIIYIGSLYSLWDDSANSATGQVRADGVQPSGRASTDNVLPLSGRPALLPAKTSGDPGMRQRPVVLDASVVLRKRGRGPVLTPRTAHPAAPR